MTRRSALDPTKGWIDEMLRSDLTAPPKQRHTDKRILDRLRDEYGFTAVAYTTLNDYLRVRRPRIREEADRVRRGRGEHGRLHGPLVLGRPG